MAAVWVFPGAMTWILNRDSCFAKVSVVMYGIPWEAWCGVQRKKHISIAVSSSVSIISSLSTTQYLSRVVFETRDSLVQTKFVELIVSTR